MDLGSKKRVRLGMTSASSKKWQPSSQRDRSLQSIPCTSIKENSRSGRQLGKPNGFQAKGDEQVAYKSEVIPENRHRRSEDSIVYSPIFPSSPETPNTADVSTSNDILSIGNEDSETTSNNYLCKWDKENRNLPVLIEQRTTSMPFSSPVAKDYTCWTKNNTSDRQSFSPITRTPSSLFSHNIANNVIDRMRINFLKVYTKAPILSSSINSECAEIAVCEAAFVNDIDSQFDCDTFFGLPLIVKELLAKYKNISHLYDWQQECLKLDAIQRRRNLIYSLPTSGGKTLVAEILIWREVIRHEKDAMFVLPYVSIVQEKIRSMNNFAVELDFIVEEYAGNKGHFPPKKHRKKHRVYVATIEKAHSLVNSLLELNRMNELGLIVVDELHMLGEPGGRGAILESLLTKLRFCANDAVIIGMSATLGNINDLKLFLDADIYCENFRPVELKEYIKIENQIYQVNSNPINEDEFVQESRTVDSLTEKLYSPEMKRLDPDCIAGLVMEVVPFNSCLVFCPTKKNCENVAVLICKLMSPQMMQIETESKKELIKALAEGNGDGKMCPILKKTIPFGVGYHHSGLTTDERSLLEEAYMAGTLCCLCCTSTLAAGVNLPAKRVLLRSPYVGNQFISHSQMKQMVGRAGRAGIDTSGESIIITNRCDRQKVSELLRVRVQNCTSSLLLNNSKGLKVLLLSAIGLELVKNSDDATKLVSFTLLNVQKEHLLREKNIQHCVSEVLTFLKDNGLVRFSQCIKDDNAADSSQSIDRALEVTLLGRATFKGAIDVEYVSRLYGDLKNGLKSLVLNTYLHLLYLITPYESLETVYVIPDIYLNTFMSLNAEDLMVAKHIGVTEPCILKIATGQKLKPPTDFIARRFYLTLILYSLWQQNSIWSVADKFQIPRGSVQNLLSSSASFGTCVLHFCQEIEELWAYQNLLDDFVKRLSYCVTMELLPLMELPHIKRGRARLLYNAGFKDLNVIAQASPEDLTRNVEFIPRKVASEIIDAAKICLIKKAEELQEEVDDIASLIV